MIWLKYIQIIQWIQIIGSFAGYDPDSAASDYYDVDLVTSIVLFCANGTWYYGDDTDYPVHLSGSDMTVTPNTVVTPPTCVGTYLE